MDDSYSPAVSLLDLVTDAMAGSMPPRGANTPAVRSSPAMIYDIDPAMAEQLQFAIINRNFVHYPIVLPPKLTPPWRPSRSGKRLISRLHPNPKTEEKLVVLALPTNFTESCPHTLRAPNRFDMDVLLRLSALTSKMQGEERHRAGLRAGRTAMRELRKDKKALHDALKEGPVFHEVGSAAYHGAAETAEIEGKVTMRFRSLRRLLQCLGRAPDQTSNRKSVTQSLQLWHHLRIRHRIWHDRGEHQDKRFAPLIEVLELPDNGRGEVLIRLNDDYMATVGRSSKNFVKAFFPLALSSEAALNLQLFLPVFSRRPNMPKTCPQNDLYDLCDKLGIAGIDERELRRGLKRALDAVNKNLLLANPHKPQYAVEFPFPDTVRLIKMMD